MSDPATARTVFYWVDHDSTIREPPVELRELARHRTVLNIGSRDISKTAVSGAFEAAFGYQLGVDPRERRGQVLEKPEQNASHTGKTVMCPVEPRDGYSYQLIIDNAGEAGTVQDIRTPVYAGRVPLAYLKYRPLADRFSNTNSVARLVATEAALSVDEQRCLGAMAKIMGVDYCEMDCLRDRNSGRLYVVDVNTTPWGPPNHLPPVEAERAIALLAEEFEQALL